MVSRIKWGADLKYAFKGLSDYKSERAWGLVNASLTALLVWANSLPGASEFCPPTFQKLQEKKAVLEIPEAENFWKVIEKTPLQHLPGCEPGLRQRYCLLPHGESAWLSR